ncbi:MAG: T9SS type A sorting domain-containing protein [Roseburia sp.]|nr:T9SS type A sorting domain-containing protein [Roseburia sp.]
MRKFLLVLFVAFTYNSFSKEVLPPEPSMPDGEIDGYEYIDLGLPSGTLWASYNVGAETPYDNGYYFAWGEVEPREYFTWENYEYLVDLEYGLGTLITLEDLGQDISGTKYDAARHLWGNAWRMPNETERYELRMYCWNKWTEENGVNGVRIYGPNKHSIFLPACGHGKWYSEPQYIGYDGGYWTGVSDVEYDINHVLVQPSTKAVCLLTDSSGLGSSSGAKATGKAIRPVINLSESKVDQQEFFDEIIHVVYSNGYIKISDINSRYKIKISNMCGIFVYEDVLENGSYKIPRLEKGIYFVSVLKNNKDIVNQKILIK